RLSWVGRTPRRAFSLFSDEDDAEERDRPRRRGQRQRSVDSPAGRTVPGHALPAASPTAARPRGADRPLLRLVDGDRPDAGRRPRRRLLPLGARERSRAAGAFHRREAVAGAPRPGPRREATGGRARDRLRPPRRRAGPPLALGHDDAHPSRPDDEDDLAALLSA